VENDIGLHFIVTNSGFCKCSWAHSSKPPRALGLCYAIEEKDKINDITGLQNLAKSLSAQHSGEFSMPWIA